jgi:hypothetical protein
MVPKTPLRIESTIVTIPMGFGDVLGEMFIGRIGIGIIGIIGDDINSSWESSSTSQILNTAHIKISIHSFF